ncbi:DUF4097 family beta strand repeat-containing protein [Pontimicrobium sp. SW4]|uniref:DUF4097 family beta strand repeat-containing protein n=1 Tax=Pontimicrobium sp. SW4 TaxID=3153519 RepID=A0AAU7BRQ5_9FLAO
MKKATLILTLIFTCNLILAQSYKELSTKKIEFNNLNGSNNLVLKNVYGNIEIEGHESNQIIIEVEKVINTADDEYLEQGKKEISYSIIEKSNEITIHPNAPFFSYDNQMNIHFNDSVPKAPYTFQLNFKVKVPIATNIDARTIGKGSLKVNGIQSQHIKTTNIAGDLILTNISGNTKAKTINGDIKISYTKNPNKASLYQSINGDIRIAYQANLNANINFNNKGGSGKLYSELKIEASKNNLTNPIEYSFKTTNGDVYLTKL